MSNPKIIGTRDLIEVLKEQRETIRELLELADRQFIALKQNDLDELSSITALLEFKGRKLALLEKRRREIMIDYTQKLGTEITYLSELLPWVGAYEKEELQSLSFEIKNLHQKLDEIQQLNHLLLKQGLAYAERVLSIFPKQETEVYGKSGNLQRLSTISGMLNKSV